MLSKEFEWTLLAQTLHGCLAHTICLSKPIESPLLFKGIVTYAEMRSKCWCLQQTHSHSQVWGLGPQCGFLEGHNGAHNTPRLWGQPAPVLVSTRVGRSGPWGHLGTALKGCASHRASPGMGRDPTDGIADPLLPPPCCSSHRH